MATFHADNHDENELGNIATVLDGGRELSKTVLYVGNVHADLPEDALSAAFSTPAFPAKSVKLLHDKNRIGFNYAFVEYSNGDHAQAALDQLNGTILADHPLKITWAFQTQQAKGTNNFNLFVGDLSLEVNDDLLSKAFAEFTSVIQANVMWDMKTGRSRGYGFVSFTDKEEAERALATKNGFILGDRPIRLNWASHKQQNGFTNNKRFNPMPLSMPLNILNGAQQPILGPQSYDLVVRQSPTWLTVVYLGNLAHYTSQNDLIPLLQNFGYIVNFKLMADKGCAFVTYDTHERAAMAIVQLNGFNINGRPLKCGWGKQSKVLRN
ncbi:Pub1 protein [Martiniozyma asiatica (nom. inval.)]|nr:Pub1 protein [Martiniozyma asiatica]